MYTSDDDYLLFSGLSDVLNPGIFKNVYKLFLMFNK